MRTFMGLLFLTLLFANLAAAQGKDSALEPGARKASDEVMADLVANRTSGAIEKVAPMKIAALEGFRTQLRQMLERCGRHSTARSSMAVSRSLERMFFPTAQRRHGTISISAKPRESQSSFG